MDPEIISLSFSTIVKIQTMNNIDGLYVHRNTFVQIHYCLRIHFLYVFTLFTDSFLCSQWTIMQYATEMMSVHLK